MMKYFSFLCNIETTVKNNLLHEYELYNLGNTAQKMKFSIKDLFSKYGKSAGNCGFGHIY